MRHPKVDKLEDLINQAYELVNEAMLLLEDCEDKAHDKGDDYSIGDLRYDLYQAESALSRPNDKFTEIYWKSYKKKPIEDLASAY